MTIITSDNVASVSLADADKPGFHKELGDSFVDYGFAIIRDHGIPQELIDRAEALSKEFFALPDETKRAYRAPAVFAGSGGLGLIDEKTAILRVAMPGSDRRSVVRALGALSWKGQSLRQRL